MHSFKDVRFACRLDDGDDRDIGPMERSSHGLLPLGELAGGCHYGRAMVCNARHADEGFTGRAGETVQPMERQQRSCLGADQQIPTHVLTVSALSEDLQLWRIKAVSQLALRSCVRADALTYSFCARTLH